MRPPPASLEPAARRWTLGVPAELALIALFSLLFALAFPSFLSIHGWFPLAYVALAPLFLVVRSATWPRVVAYGPLAGFLSYALFNYWLAKFHPITIFVVPPIHAAYFLALLPALKAADTLFPRAGFLVQVAVWLGYEYLKVQGFLGYPWGVLGYSQYTFLPLIGSARLGGVWLVSLVVVLPSAVLSAALLRLRPVDRSVPARPPRALVLGAGAAAVALVGGSLIYTAFTRVSTAADPTLRVALIQQNSDPWKTQYKRTLDTLLDLSDRALAEDPDIVVWSETSFVPAIDYHRRYRDDLERYELVRRLLEYLERQSVPFVVGNDDGQRRRDPDGVEIRVDFNAAILFHRGEVVDTYRKMHLVPFTEHFPFQRTLPGLYAALAANPEIHFWEKGETATVFEAAGVRFSTPICFEDSFGYLSRAFVRNGAQLIVNMTNDSWSKSVTAEMQHMAMAVFRAVENGRSVVRSTNGGMTVTIDPNGRILDMLEPFVESYLVSDVPVHDRTDTLYTALGDWVGQAALGLALLLLAAAGLTKAAARLSRRGR